MRTLAYLIAFTAAACGFGDNHVTNGISHHACGDGVLDPGEGCDDGNTSSGDGCSEACAVEAANPVCGNGVREVGEACDDGNSATGDGCSATCEVESVCGNGIREAGEDCDNHNTSSGDGCSSTCHVETATACGLVPQSGCDAGKACDLTGDTGDTSCRAITAQGKFDNKCTEDTACAAGFTCAFVTNSDTISTCMKFCEADGDCQGGRCVFGLDNSQGQPINVKVCSNLCNPLTQTGCASGLGCLPFDSSGGDFTDCAVMDGALDGDACTAQTDCLAGSVCVTAGGTKRCREMCNTASPTTCDAGDTCSPFSPGLTINNVTLGGCQ